ncbi:hypothetical protein R2N23_004681 [Pseudomonas aeruginosa]|nr:hypothetical protein [Pseudomonas aeruginosa]
MKILGISLHTPSTKDLGGFLVRVLVGVVVVALLVQSEMLSVKFASGVLPLTEN